MEQQPLASKLIIFCHDVLNKSKSSHRFNNYTFRSLEDLIGYLQSKRQQISVIVYCRRKGTPDIFEDLQKRENRHNGNKEPYL